MSTEPGNAVRATAGSDRSHPAPRRVVFIVGSGRSGTSALACTLQALGMHVPPPEVEPDSTNPKGFGESQWVIDFHDRLLRRANVRVADARPTAWFDTGKLSTNERIRERVHAWLQDQFTAERSEIVLKDPRLPWFIGLWRTAVLRGGVEPAYAVMLRPPAEVIGSKQLHYNPNVSESSRAASWVNHMLHTERATRGFRRGFIRYHDLLDDWTVPIYRLGEALELQTVRSATAKELRRVHDFIDPNLRRVRLTWDDIAVPKPLRTIVEESWQHLDRLTDGDDTPEMHAILDELRLEYTRLYEEAEGMTESTALAFRRKALAEKQSGDPSAEPPDAADDPPPPEPARTGRKRGLLNRRGGG